MEDLKTAAIKVLRSNDLGNCTKPAPRLYPHQWNWDSAFIAIGLSHLDEIRAQAELKTLIQAQWSNGMIPHIVFNPTADDYRPGPDYWGRDLTLAPGELRTSGITQPPILAFAALEVFNHSCDEQKSIQFLREIYPALVHYSTFLLRERDPDGQGLSFICHPWESGMDNASNWDQALHQFDLDFKPRFMRRDNQHIPDVQRPSDKEYMRYSYLVQRYAMESWDWSRIHDLRLFAVQSVLFNSLHLRSLEALISIAEIIDEDPHPISDMYRRLSASIESRLWNKETGRYQDFDLVSDCYIGSDNISKYIPLFTGYPDHNRAVTMISDLLSSGSWPETGWGVCSESLQSTNYDPVLYWRGPVWINMNWMIIRGLEIYGAVDLASRLAGETLELVEQNGFYEYFNPETGEGLGSDSFSWTAALVIDLIESGY